MFRFRPETKFIVFINCVSFTATAKKIRQGVGGYIQCNEAVQKALDSLEFIGETSCEDPIPNSISGTWSGLTVYLSKC
jgi:hypothetical protein